MYGSPSLSNPAVENLVRPTRLLRILKRFSTIYSHSLPRQISRPQDAAPIYPVCPGECGTRSADPHSDCSAEPTPAVPKISGKLCDDSLEYSTNTLRLSRLTRWREATQETATSHPIHGDPRTCGLACHGPCNIPNAILFLVGLVALARCFPPNRALPGSSPEYCRSIQPARRDAGAILRLACPVMSH